MEKTDPRHLLANIAKILQRLKIPYLVSGGIAVLLWGRPRFTADIDIVIELPRNKADSLEKALHAIGKSGYLDRGAVELAIKTQGEFNFIDGETGVKIDFWILKEKDPFDISRLKRKCLRKVLRESIYFSSPEDLILMKLKWYQESGSSRQLEDVESIFKISGEALDREYLEKWAECLGIKEILRKFAF